MVGIRGPPKGPRSLGVFKAKICILSHSRDSLSLITDTSFNTKKLIKMLLTLEISCFRKQGISQLLDKRQTLLEIQNMGIYTPVKRNFILLYFKKKFEQECIPVGCVQSTAVVVSGGGVPRGVSAGGCTPLPVDRMTDTGENITFPQLLLQTVKTAGRKFKDSTKVHIPSLCAVFDI